MSEKEISFLRPEVFLGRSLLHRRSQHSAKYIPMEATSARKSSSCLNVLLPKKQTNPKEINPTWG